MMKNAIIYAMSLMILLGCSKRKSEIEAIYVDYGPTIQTGMTPGRPSPVHVVPVHIVETAETKEMNDISNRVEMMLEAKDYDGLEAFTKEFRDSNERYARGAWKFYFVYQGLDLAEGASNTVWLVRLAALHDYINAKTNSITARVALANDLVTYAWKARGDGWADTVTEEGWRLFGQRLNEAVKVLDDAGPLKEQCPYWWSVKLEAELGLGTERSQYDATFDEATRAWPDYDPYYNHRAWYLMPRWNGTEGEWESDLEKSANRKGGEAGDLLYARVVWCQHQSHSFSNIFKQCNLSWPRVNRGFEVMEKRFPNSLAAKSEHAYLAVLARDATIARKEFDEINGKADLSVWPSLVKFVAFAGWAYSPAE